MIGLDTNVLVRYLTQDDPVQSPKATSLIERRLTERDPGFISTVAMVETVSVWSEPTGSPPELRCRNRADIAGLRSDRGPRAGGVHGDDGHEGRSGVVHRRPDRRARRQGRMCGNGHVRPQGRAPGGLRTALTGSATTQLCQLTPQIVNSSKAITVALQLPTLDGCGFLHRAGIDAPSRRRHEECLTARVRCTSAR